MKEETKIKLMNKFEKFKAGVKWKFNAAADWCEDHPKVVAGVVAGVMFGVNITKKYKPTQAQLDDAYRANHYYDDSTRTWYKLRRNISEETRRQIYREQHDGRDLESILIERGLYKREH